MTDDNNRSLTLLERETLVFQDPELMTKICRHVSSGGTVIKLCELWQIYFADLMRFIRADQHRKDLYNQALADREEWTYERILMELRAIGTVDIRELYDDNGNLKVVSDWPSGAAAAVAGVDVFEEYEGSGNERNQIGTVRKLKLIDKIKALELAGKTQKMFTDRVESTTVVRLEDLVMGSWPDETQKPINVQPRPKPITPSKSGSHDQSSNGHQSPRDGREDVQDVQTNVQGDEEI